MSNSSANSALADFDLSDFAGVRHFASAAEAKWLAIGRFSEVGFTAVQEQLPAFEKTAGPWRVVQVDAGYLVSQSTSAEGARIELKADPQVRHLPDRQLADEPTWRAFGRRAEFVLQHLAELGYVYSRSLSYASDGELILDVGPPERALTFIFDRTGTEAMFNDLVRGTMVIRHLPLLPEPSALAELAREYKVTGEWQSAIRQRLQRPHSSAVDSLMPQVPHTSTWAPMTA